ncbi:MAG: aminopeptidase P family protein [Bacteroidales bacterium]|nr:aminopeptidase P family protein [Bacteroidales bacterium]
MYRTKALGMLRQKLSEMGVSAVIIPTNDPHFGEYTQNYYKIREWLSGFDGSAGTLVVTEKSAALWTDSRYFIQAQEQLKGSDIRLMKLKMPQTPAIWEWILNQYPDGGKVAIDRALFSYSEYEKLQQELKPCTVELVDDLFADIWENRPTLVFNPIISLDVKYAGESAKSKFNRVVEALNIKEQMFVYIVSACDQVAWLCNIRGTDIDYNPVPQSYAVVTNTAVHLFVDLNSVGDELNKHLTSQGIELHPYSSFTQTLQQIPASTLRICSKGSVTVRDYNALDIPGATFIEDPTLGGTINYFKAIKNNGEKEGFRKAFLEDGKAWCKLLKYIDDSLASSQPINEWTIGEKLIEFRKESPDYKGESFEPIVAFGKAAALPHYSATEESAQIIGNNNFLLMDTGAHYPYGTTDTTRTIPIGTLTEQQKRHYTLVLKGMIALSMAKFPQGTRGSQLDILARGPLFSDGVMYFHGTGHGLGHYLCVHEGPQSIRMEENPVALAQGMVISNEPAVYIPDQYGIRTENVILVRECEYNSFNTFLNFETLTLVPIDLSCVLPQLLSQSEKDWINSYNMHVCNTIAPYLDMETAQWLSNKYKTSI